MSKIKLIGLNAKRAEWAKKAVDVFADECGTDGLETDIGDLITDLLHLCDREGLDHAKILDRAQRYYGMEMSVCLKCGVSYDGDTDGDEKVCKGCM